MPQSKTLIAVLGTLILSIASDAAQAQQRGMHGPRWGFAVVSASSKDLRHPRLTRTWNATDNLDSVWILIGRSHTAPIDSIRISIRSGPSALIRERDPAVAAARSDSLGQWVTLPGTLVRLSGGERNTPVPMRVLGVFSPSAIASWARSQNPNHPVVTRVAADIWRRKAFERAELYLEFRAADAKLRITAPSRKTTPLKPVTR